MSPFGVASLDRAPLSVKPRSDDSLPGSCDPGNWPPPLSAAKDGAMAKTPRVMLQRSRLADFVLSLTPRRGTIAVVPHPSSHHARETPMLEFLCSTCGKRVQGEDALAGKLVVCPACNAAITAPQANAAGITTAAHVKIAAAAADTAFSEGTPPLPPAPTSIQERLAPAHPPPLRALCNRRRHRGRAGRLARSRGAKSARLWQQRPGRNRRTTSR